MTKYRFSLIDIISFYFYQMLNNYYFITIKFIAIPIRDIHPYCDILLLEIRIKHSLLLNDFIFHADEQFALFPLVHTFRGIKFSKKQFPTRITWPAQGDISTSVHSLHNAWDTFLHVIVILAAVIGV